MSDDETKRFQGTPEFERVQATLERLAAQIERVEAYIKTVEEKIDKQGYNTKPIWETIRADTEKTKFELVEVNRNLGKLNRRVGLFNDDLTETRITQREHDERLARLELDEGGLTRVN